MAANELQERLQAQIWVKVEPLFGTGLLANDGIGIRSICGFEQRIILSAVPKTYPLFILPLERYHTRKESCVMVQNIVTVDEARFSYPGTSTPAASYQAPPKIEPIDLAWMGNLAAPSWYPFGFATPLPAAFDANLFNAIAVYLPLNVNTLAGDFVVSVLRCPPIEGSVILQKIVPNPLPPPGP